MRNSTTENIDEFGKVGAETSYLQSQMHSDHDSAESSADSDVEDGELRKMLASPLNRLAAMVQERSKCKAALKLITREEKVRRQVHLKNREQRGNLLQCFRQEMRNQEINSTVLFSKTADPSNLGRSLLEGNEDHLLSQAKSELMRQEHQVGSLNNCISELGRTTRIY